MRLFIRIIIVIHLFFILFSVTHLYDKVQLPILSGLNSYYSAVTYTNRCFGFFAPEVYGDLKIKIKMYKDLAEIPFELPKDNFDLPARIYSLGGHFGEDGEQTTMDLFARSWGLYCLNKYTNIDKVNVFVSQNNIPTINEYNNGKKITQDSFYITDIEPR